MRGDFFANFAETNRSQVLVRTLISLISLISRDHYAENGAKPAGQFSAPPPIRSGYRDECRWGGLFNGYSI